jgi:hypothetical protein
MYVFLVCLRRIQIKDVLFYIYWKYNVSVNIFGYFINQSSCRITNHVTDQLNKLALDWNQLCILPARQSYIRQYGKMASRPEKAFSALSFHETKSVVTVERQFGRKYGKSPPSQPSIRAWYKPCVTNGCVCVCV